MRMKNRVMIFGGIIGALLGVSAAYLFLKSNPPKVGEEGEERLPTVQPAKALAIGLAVLGVLKQISGMNQN